MSRPSGAELDAVPLDLLGHARRHLGALQHHDHVVEDDRILELERRQPRQDLLEALAIRLERPDGLVRLCEHRRDRVELVARVPGEDRHGLALLGDRDHERARLLRDALRGPVPRPGLVRRDRRVRHQLDVRVGELRQGVLTMIAPSIFASS